MGPVSPPLDAETNEPPAEFVEQISIWLGSNDFSENTVKLYGDAATRWLRSARPWEADWQVRSIDWRKSLTGKALKTQAVFVGAAKSFVEHLLERKLIEGRNPFASVRFRGLASAGLRRRALSDEEVRQLLGSCDLKTELGLRDHTVLTVMLYTALRIGAVSRICVEDIEQQGEFTVVKYQGKGQRGKDRVKMLPAPVLTAIKAYLKKTGRTLKGTGVLFVGRGEQFTIHGMRKAIKRRLARCGIQDSAVTVHSLRHTAATKAVDAGNDLKAVQDLLDHGSLATTDRYVHSVRQHQQAAQITIDYDMGGKRGNRGRRKGRKRKGT